MFENQLTLNYFFSAFSFSATRGDCPFPLNPPNANGFEDPGDDSETEMVSDWDDEDHLAQLARREPSKFRETLRLEVRLP
jgi:hypothetical protein